MRQDPLWVYIGAWPEQESRPTIATDVAHLWRQIAVACKREDYGLTAAAEDTAPRCEQCVMWLASQ